MHDDLDTDPDTAQPRRTVRHRRFNTAELPAMRVLGFALIAGASALHNGLIDLELTRSPRLSVGAFTAIAAVYCLLSWLALRPRRRGCRSFVEDVPECRSAGVLGAEAPEC